MAERYGGRFSPANARREGPPGPPVSRWDRKRRSRAGGRSNILFFLPFLFLWDAFLGPAQDFVPAFAAFAALFLAAWLTRQASSPRKPTMPAPWPSARRSRARYSPRS